MADDVISEMDRTAVRCRWSRTTKLLTARIDSASRSNR